MSMNNPAAWLVAKAKTGVRDLPSNAAWLVTKAVAEPAGSAVNGVEEAAASIRRTAADVLPGTGSNGVDRRLGEARAAVEQAQLAEREAVSSAERARQLVDALEDVDRRHRERRAAAEREREDAIEKRVRDARQRADAMVAEERTAAEAEEDRRLASLDEELTEERREAENRAASAQEEARNEVLAAEQQMAAAQQLAEEAAALATEAAREAHRAAEELATHARTRADEAEHQLETARELGASAAATTASLERDEAVEAVAAPLRERTVKQLLPIAASLGIENRSRMRHDELVRAIASARGAETRRAGRSTSRGSSAKKSTTKKTTTRQPAGRNAGRGKRA